MNHGTGYKLYKNYFVDLTILFNMSTQTYSCPYCRRSDFKSRRGLTQHQKNTPKCRAQVCSKFGVKHNPTLPHNNIPTQQLIPTLGRNPSLAITPTLDKSPSLKLGDVTNHDKFAPNDARTCREQKHCDVEPADFTSLNDDTDESDGRLSVGTADANENNPSLQLITDFNKYAIWATHNLIKFTSNQVAAIRLVSTLRKTKAPLTQYETVLDWHFRVTGQLEPSQSISECDSYITRKKLFKSLRTRYNFKEGMYNNTHEMTLPHSQSRAKVVWNDAGAVIRSLLTDPRITDDDYLFFGDNPLQGPPNNLNYVQDLNAGRAYTATYHSLIARPDKQVLLPVIFYIDGANTGQFVDLPLTAVKITLGIFTREARDKDYLWRTLGFIPSYSQHVSRGRRLMVESHHMDSRIAFPDTANLASGIPVNNTPKAQDLHCILDKIFESYIELQNTGFYWDLAYKNKVYENIEFVLFTPFFKVDSDEAEKLCGKFTSRTGNVAQLCRYCECPTNESDKPFVNYELKTTAKIKGMIAANDIEGLRQLSQHCIQNSMYKLRFGTHNNQGIHGACPMDMLHALLLGMFRYIRDCFFEQIGPTSRLTDEINACARQYGELISRQSDRDYPKTRFASGILRGKLNAKDFPGILLCLGITMRCTAVREMLPRRRRLTFNAGVVRDWQLLIDTLLQWEQWLKSDKLQLNHVKKSQQKHRYLMYLMKKVGRRVEGMGLKITKFHSIMHLTDDILNFGVPMEVDTGSNESGHKLEKTAAKLTQKNKELFDIQTAHRLEELHLIDLAESEIDGNSMWEYSKFTKSSIPKPQCTVKPYVGGLKYYVEFNRGTQQKCWCTCNKKRGQSTNDC